jgi:hypothetical protein
MNVRRIPSEEFIGINNTNCELIFETIHVCTKQETVDSNITSKKMNNAVDLIISKCKGAVTLISIERQINNLPENNYFEGLLTGLLRARFPTIIVQKPRISKTYAFDILGMSSSLYSPSKNTRKQNMAQLILQTLNSEGVFINETGQTRLRDLIRKKKYDATDAMLLLFIAINQTRCHPFQGLQFQ